jgi:hypothetical protein
MTGDALAGDPPSLPEPTRDVKQGLRNIGEFGVTLHPGFLSSEMTKLLQQRLEEQAYMERLRGGAFLGAAEGILGRMDSEAGVTAQPIFQAVSGLANKGRVFIDLFMHETAHEYARGVFDPHPWQLWAQNGLITSRGANEQLLHRDQMLPPEMNTRPAMLNILMAISDFELEMGPTGVVPGSHLGPAPDGYDDEFRTPRAPAVCKAGTAIIIEGRTWHGQGTHDSDKSRYAIAMSFSLYAYRQGFNYAAGLTDSVYQTLSEDALQVLGFQNEQEGFLGHFGPRNEADRRANLGDEPKYLPEMHR